MPKRDDAHMLARRQQIMDAARTCIETKGVAAASMSEISAAAGLSIGAIYTHFSSKEEILVQIMRQYSEAQDWLEGCNTAQQMFNRISALLNKLGKRDEAHPEGRTAFEIAALARRIPAVHEAMEFSYQHLRQSMLKQVQLVAPEADRTLIATICESLVALLLSAQFQMVAGLSADTAAKRRAVRALIAQVYSGPLK